MADGGGLLDGRRMRVRALFLSDLHLGARACHAERVLELLTGCEADTLYLIGDVVDGWRLRARWYWPRSHDAVVRWLLGKQAQGTRILYIPGNHDEFLRHSIGLRLGGIEVVEEAIHEAADGSRHLVLHGDRLDPLVRRMRRLAGIGVWAYALGVMANDAVAAWRRKLRHGRPQDGSSRRIAAFEAAATAVARDRGLQGIICGHVHCPALHDRHGIRYINVGDWFESCTAAVEHLDGRFEMLTWPFRADLSPDAAVAPIRDRAA
jgi:UDP-2,3-diacylglucosamine pyrophosphatase LpxH